MTRSVVKVIEPLCRCVRAMVFPIAALAGASALANSDMTPEEVISARQANLRDLGGAFKEISDQLKKDKPALPLLRQYAVQMDDLAKQLSHWFPEGTGPDSGLDTKAKVEIWIQPGEFQQVQREFEVEAAKFRLAAEGQDLAAIRAQRKVVGRICSGCHERFRTEDD